MGDEQNPIPPTICTCSTPKALFKVIKLQSKNKELSRDTNARICIESKGRHSPRGYISSASRIGSAVGALFTFVHHTNYQDIVTYRIPKKLINGTTVEVEGLQKFEDLTRSGPTYPGAFLQKIGSCVIIPDQPTATIFYLLPFVLQDESLFDACSFFRTCCSDYSFMDGVVGEVLREPEQEPADPQRSLKTGQSLSPENRPTRMAPGTLTAVEACNLRGHGQCLERRKETASLSSRTARLAAAANPEGHPHPS